MSEQEENEFELIEIAPWWWDSASEDERERHRKMNPFFVPRVVKIKRQPVRESGDVLGVANKTG